MRISDWSSDVCSSDLGLDALRHGLGGAADRVGHVEHADGRDEGRHVQRAGLAERAPGRRLDLVDRAEHPVGVDQALAELAQVVVRQPRSEEHTSELQALMRTSYAVVCLKKKNRGTEYAQKLNE